MQSPSPEAPHACEQRSCALPSQLGGSLSCGPLSTAGHMLCTALQTTQRFINTAQIRLFTHRGEAEIARSAQPCNAPGSRILPISPAEVGKASRLLDCLGPFASRALGVRPFAPGGDRTLYHIPISTALLEHSRSGTPSTPNPTPPSRLCGISLGPQTPRPQPLITAAAPLPTATGVTSALDSLSPATRPLPGREPPTHACHAWLLAAAQDAGSSHAAPTRSLPTLPGAARARTHRPAGTGPRHPRSPHPSPARFPPLTSRRLLLLLRGGRGEQQHREQRDAQPQRGRRGHGGTGTRGRWGGRRLSRAAGVGRDRRGRAGGGPELLGPGARSAAGPPRAAACAAAAGAAGRGASPLSPSVPAAPVRAQPRRAWAPPRGFGVGTGGNGVRGLFHGVGRLRWGRDAGRRVPASAVRPEDPASAAPHPRGRVGASLPTCVTSFQPTRMQTAGRKKKKKKAQIL